MRTKSYYKFESGFTLIEAIVSVALFAVAISSIIGVFLSIQRLNRTAIAAQTLEQNARFLSEDLTKLIRNGSIDYHRASPCYNNMVPVGAATNLCLFDQEGQQVRVYRSGSTLYIEKAGQTTNYSGDDVKVTNFRAYIQPISDPFESGVNINRQPTITVFIEMSPANGLSGQEIFGFQVTAATKQYPVEH